MSNPIGGVIYLILDSAGQVGRWIFRSESGEDKRNEEEKKTDGALASCTSFPTAKPNSFVRQRLKLLSHLNSRLATAFLSHPNSRQNPHCVPMRGVRYGRRALAILHSL
jgi:hypothetical protein